MNERQIPIREIVKQRAAEIVGAVGLTLLTGSTIAAFAYETPGASGITCPALPETDNTASCEYKSNTADEVLTVTVAYGLVLCSVGGIMAINRMEKEDE